MPNLFQPEIASDLDAQQRVRRWIAALRRDEYPQAASCLRTTSGFCCLGVACDLFNDSVWRRFSGNGAEWSYLGASIALPRPVVDAYRLVSPHGHYGVESHGSGAPSSRSLADDNDSGKTFAEIADIIEQELEAALTTAKGDGR